MPPARLARLRRSWALRLTRPSNLFQPWNDTWDDRYPEVFAFLGRELSSKEDVHVLSFGCSTGEEVFSLRRFLPRARLKGIDISRGNVAECRRRLRQLADRRIEFVRAGSAAFEPDQRYDAVLCMAVFRHGSLAEVGEGGSCARLLRFEDFARTVEDLTRCLAPGGYLVVEHSNFRVADTPAARRLEVVVRRPPGEADRRTPVFGPDDRRIPGEPGPVEVVFRKRAAGGSAPGGSA